MRRALIVGIDHYPTAGDLTGCVADAKAMNELLSRNDNNSPNWSTKLLTSRPGDTSITRNLLRKELRDTLFRVPRDYDLLFYFAGHGAQTPWGADLVAQDASQANYGMSMNDVLTLSNDSPARSVTILLDCCFSGEIGNVPGQQSAGVAEAFRIDKALLRENVTIMAAARGTEVSRESGGHGEFTRLLIDGLGGGATDHQGRVTALSLYGYVSPAFDAFQQRPVIKSYLTEPVVLRVGPPWIEPSLLQQLPNHFPREDHRIPLTPAHEGDNRPLPPGNPGTREQQEFDYLARLRNANLVTTDDRRDHYWVAMDGGHVYLTPLGRYFWDLASRHLL